MLREQIQEHPNCYVSLRRRKAGVFKNPSGAAFSRSTRACTPGFIGPRIDFLNTPKGVHRSRERDSQPFDIMYAASRHIADCPYFHYSYFLFPPMHAAPLTT